MFDNFPALPWSLIKVAALLLSLSLGGKFVVYYWGKLKNVLCVLFFATVAASAQTTVEPGTTWAENLEQHLTLENGAETFTLSGSQYVPLRPDGFDAELWPTGEGSTVLGELRAVRLLLENVIRVLFILAGLKGWSIFASNIKV